MDNKLKTIIFSISVLIVLLFSAIPTISIFETSQGYNSCNQPSNLPIFPGAEGFGTNTRAAYGGINNPVIYRVTNLNNNGPGSLREALTASEPRVIIFEVSGYIDLLPDPYDSRFSIFVKNPYLYVAGQTAPSPGITIRGGPIVIETHYVVFQHLCIRPGDIPSGTDYEYRDCIDVHNCNRGNTYNIVFDHLSLSWGTDELSNTWYETNDITYQYCIFSEALHTNLHPKGKHSCGLIIGPDSRDTSIHHNLFAHNAGRNPLVEPAGNTELINNVIYDWEWIASDFIYYPYESNVCTDPGPKYCNIIGNYYIDGPSTKDNIAISVNKEETPSKFFIHDNIGPWRTSNTQDDWDIVFGDQIFRSNSPTFSLSGIRTYSSERAYDIVLNNVGARPADRDEVDKRIIWEVQNREGNIISSQEEVGGWPDLQENYRTLTIPNNPHKDSDGDGYTNLDEWLHYYSSTVENVNNNQEKNKMSLNDFLRIILIDSGILSEFFKIIFQQIVNQIRI